MPPATVYIPQTMTGNGGNEMIMTNSEGSDPMGGSAPAYGYMNYPIVYGPPAPPAAVAPPRPGNNAGYVWYPAQQSGQLQMTSSGNISQ
jgi:hypothetical protein